MMPFENEGCREVGISFQDCQAIVIAFLSPTEAEFGARDGPRLRQK
jgi:hypothetical protein